MDSERKHLIFDFDGVLGDTLDAYIEVIKERYPDTTEEEIKTVFLVEHHNEPKYRRGHKLTSEEVEESMKFRIGFGKRLIKRGFDLFEDFVQEIAKIENAKLAIVSSGSRVSIDPKAEESRLGFSHVMGAEDSLSKEEKVEMICKDWGINPSQAFYFTDTKSDVVELRDIMGLDRLIGCSWGWHGFKKLSEVLPEKQILKKFEDIHKIVK